MYNIETKNRAQSILPSFVPNCSGGGGGLEYNATGGKLSRLLKMAWEGGNGGVS